MRKQNRHTEEQHLLRKLYECQETMAELLDDGVNDEHYKLIQVLISRLEKHLIDKLDLI
jgi:hypothetical protein